MIIFSLFLLQNGKEYGILVLTIVDESKRSVMKADQLKQMNLQKIKDYFYREKKASKNRLSEDTGISKTTCTVLLKELLEEGFLCRDADYDSTGGRPRKAYCLNSDYEHDCLVYLKQGEPHEIRIQVRDLGGNQRSSLVKKADSSCMECLYQMLDVLLEEDSKITVIAVSLPGVMDEKHQILSCDIWELEGQNLSNLLKQRYGVEIVVENDVNLAAVGYHTEESSLAFLYQPKARYSGCGIMLNHQLYRGNTTFAGEIGYLRGCAFWEPEDFDAAQELILHQLSALICVLNPAQIVLCSCYEFQQERLLKQLEQEISLQHLPRLQIVSKLEPYVFEGLMEAAVDAGRNHLKMEEVRRL